MVNVVLDSELAERHIIITDKSKYIVLMNVTVMKKVWNAKDSKILYLQISFGSNGKRNFCRNFKNVRNRTMTHKLFQMVM